MSVKFTKRLSAYLIDFIILTLTISVITTIIPSSSKLEKLNEELTNLQDDYINKKIETSEYLDKYQNIIPEYDKENVIINICNLIFILGYFVIIPVVNNGQTLGKKLMKIKVVKNNGNLTIRDMIMRNFVTTSLLQLMISSIFIYILDNSIYFNVVSFIGVLQVLLVIITTFMILYRKDKKGVQDLITDTSVVEV